MNDGRLLTGILDAENKDDLKRKFTAGYIIHISLYDNTNSFYKRGVPIKVLLRFTKQLRAIIDAGIPILTGLNILWKEMNNKQLQIIISHIQNKLTAGSRFSEAVNDLPQVFPPLYRSLVPIGESGADLSIILGKLVDYYTNQTAFTEKIKKAMTYPVIVIVMVFLVVVGMMMFVVPFFEKFFHQMHLTLPRITTMVINLSDMLRTWQFFVILVGGFFGVTYAYKKMKANPVTETLIDKWKLRLPLVGRIFYYASLERFTRTLSLLMSAGITINRGLELSSQTILNKVLENSLAQVRVKITEGQALSDALRDTKLFPDLLVEMTGVGEKSGTLSTMLLKMADTFNEELNEYIEWLLSLMEPVLILLVAGVVLLTLLTLYLPIISLWKGMASVH